MWLKKLARPRPATRAHFFDGSREGIALCGRLARKKIMMRKRRTPTIATLDEPGFQHLSTATNHNDRGNTDNHRTSTNVIPFMAIAIVNNTKTTMTIQSTTTNMSEPNIKMTMTTLTTKIAISTLMTTKKHERLPPSTDN